MIGRGVAEAGHHERVGRPRRGQPEPGRPGERERQADGPGQVGCDRRGLRNDVQVLVAEHLVPAARDRLAGGGGQPEQHVVDAIGGSPGLRGSGQVKTPGPVVQQGRVGQAQGGSYGGVGLVAGGADRVEPAVARAHPAGGRVEMTAGQLRVEDLQQAAEGKAAARSYRISERRCRWLIAGLAGLAGLVAEAADRRDQMMVSLAGFEVSPSHALCRKLRSVMGQRYLDAVPLSGQRDHLARAEPDGHRGQALGQSLAQVEGASPAVVVANAVPPLATPASG